MDRAEALRSIRYDLLEYIQKKVRVDFDHNSQRAHRFQAVAESAALRRRG